AGETVEIGAADEPPLEVPLLWPRIGIKEVDLGERGGRQPVENVDGIAVEQADIAETELGNGGYGLGHSVQEGLDADEADIGVPGRRIDQMLAAAEADFETDLAHGDGEDGAELGRAGAGKVDGKRRVDRRHQREPPR